MSSASSPTTNDTLLEACKKAFGPDGSVTKQWAADEGDALFTLFMGAFERALTLNPPADDNQVAMRVKITKNARSKRYHDFEGDLMKMGLVSDLKAAGLEELSMDVMMGEYDF